MLRIIKRNFAHICWHCFVILYKLLVRSYLKYNNSVWYSKIIADIHILQRVHIRAIKLIPKLSNKPYNDRIKNLHLPTLIYRPYRRNMIELMKIIKGMYDPTCVSYFHFTELSKHSIRTTGNGCKLTQHHCHYDLRKYTYTNTNRVIPTSNTIWLCSYCING